MVDSEPPDDDRAPHLPNAADAGLWARFRQGEVVPCVRGDSGNFALQVDGAAKCYRLVCTQCGLASPWFGANGANILVRGPQTTLVPSAKDD